MRIRGDAYSSSFLEQIVCWTLITVGPELQKNRVLLYLLLWFHLFYYLLSQQRSTADRESKYTNEYILSEHRNLGQSVDHPLFVWLIGWVRNLIKCKTFFHSRYENTRFKNRNGVSSVDLRLMNGANRTVAAMEIRSWKRAQLNQFLRDKGFKLKEEYQNNNGKEDL